MTLNHIAYCILHIVIGFMPSNHDKSDKNLNLTTSASAVSPFGAGPVYMKFRVHDFANWVPSIFWRMLRLSVGRRWTCTVLYCTVLYCVLAGAGPVLARGLPQVRLLRRETGRGGPLPLHQGQPAALQEGLPQVSGRSGHIYIVDISSLDISSDNMYLQW